jgi:hypothetical protein
MAHDLHRIYHAFNYANDLTADDFAHAFILRKFCGQDKIGLYAALRATGHDQAASFVCSFGSQFYGGMDAIAKATQAFESTSVFESAFEDAVETLGQEFIQLELAKRCQEIGGFTRDSAMALSMHLHQQGNTELASGKRDTHGMRRDDAMWKEFAEKRRGDVETIQRRDAIQRNQVNLEVA